MHSLAHLQYPHTTKERYIMPYTELMVDHLMLSQQDTQILTRPHQTFSLEAQSINEAIKTRDAQASLGYPDRWLCRDGNAEQRRHRLGRPFLDAVLPRFTCFSSSSAAYHDERHGQTMITCNAYNMCTKYV